MTAIRPHFWSTYALTLLAHAMLGFVLFAAPAATADETGEPSSGLIIEDAVVSVAPKGGTATLGFRIENLTAADYIKLINIRTAKILVKLSNSKSAIFHTGRRLQILLRKR